MSRKTTPTGQQYSESTPFKLKAFRYFMGFHGRVCQIIQKKHGRPYIYIDLNCGSGYQPEYKEFGDEVFGSPIIALQELNKNGIEPICHFCDVSEESLESLKRTIGDLNLQCSATYWLGDNKNSIAKIQKELGSSDFQGLIYSDPNGKQDFPLNEIQEILRTSQMKRVDLLMNVATTYIKRWVANPKTNWDVCSLEELLSNNSKKRVFIRQPEDKDKSLKWTFIYATNWADQKNLKSIRLYDLKDRVGKAIKESIFSPRSNPSPAFNDDGSVGTQMNLFDN